MSLSASLSNALSGMHVSQNSLEVLSRNVANSGTPGYHRQSLTVIDSVAGSSSYARSGNIERAFNKSLQVFFTNAVSDTAYATSRVDALDRLQWLFGRPGADGSLDTMFGQLQNAFQALNTSPDSYATRATVVSRAQQIATGLNSLTREVQALRQEAETQMSNAVDQLNLSLTALQKVTQKLADVSGGEASRATLMDQRDRLVSDIAQYIDVRVDYRADGTVALMTRNGVGLLDGNAVKFSFHPAGAMSADKLASNDPAQNGVGRILISTMSGSQIDVVQQNVAQSGTLAALVELRDKTLVAAQSQLDEIAAGLAQALSTINVAGDEASVGTQSGYELDLGGIRNGNDFTLNYTAGGASRSIKVVRVDQPDRLPLDYIDANGARVVGMQFTGDATNIAAGLQAILGSGFTVSSAGNTLTVLDDGAAGTTDVGSLIAHQTSTGTQIGSAALNLFVDTNNSDFTNSLSDKTQKLGFAGRISVNAEVLIDNTILVKQLPSSSIGDPVRVDHLLSQLQNASFASAQRGPVTAGTFRLGGTIGDMISQTMNQTGAIAQMAASEGETQMQALESIDQRLQSEYGVNVDEEMARLIELQNAYAANSRVISTVQELLRRLMDI